MSVLDTIKPYWRFTWDLREFLNKPVTLEYSKQLVRERLQNRENNLLKLAKYSIYDNPSSPYLQLLKLAGCEYGDFEKMVCQDGVEVALVKLRQEGVYISIDEFKGRLPVRRGGMEFSFKEHDFDNPFQIRHLTKSSGQTHGPGIRLYYDLDFITQNRSIYRTIVLEALNAWNFPHVECGPIMPGAGTFLVLEHTRIGKPPAKWFSPIRSEQFKPSLKNRFATDLVIHTGRFWGSKLPFPEYIAFDELWRIAEWIDTTIKQYSGCYVTGSPSKVVAICTAAKDKGYSLAGTRCSLGAEPLTSTKRIELESAGMTVSPEYAFTEGGYAGFGCFSPLLSDELHLTKDSLATVQYTTYIPHMGMSVEALLFTSLLFSSPKILLNVENGDYGTIETRSCGCIFDELGLVEHLHSIRSFEKFTSQGMTLFGIDLFRIVEKVLPDRFGGTSIDYQILEEEDRDGRTYMTIVARPELGELDENAIIEVVLSEIQKGDDAYRMAAEMWSQTKAIRVKRINPVTTPGAKLPPFYTMKAT
jgi:hypothetical protein